MVCGYEWPVAVSFSGEAAGSEVQSGVEQVAQVACNVVSLFHFISSVEPSSNSLSKPEISPIGDFN